MCLFWCCLHLKSVYNRFQIKRNMTAGLLCEAPKITFVEAFFFFLLLWLGSSIRQDAGDHVHLRCQSSRVKREGRTKEAKPPSPTNNVKRLKYSAYSDWMTKDLMPKSLLTVWQDRHEKWSAKWIILAFLLKAAAWQEHTHTHRRNAVTPVNTPPSALFYPSAFHGLHARLFVLLRRQHLPGELDVRPHSFKDEGSRMRRLYIAAWFMLTSPVLRGRPYLPLCQLVFVVTSSKHQFRLHEKLSFISNI